MNRRHFLKMCALSGAMAIASNIPLFRAIASTELELPDEKWFGTIRELHHLDIYENLMIIKYDVWSPKHNSLWGVDIQVPPDLKSLQEFEERYKKPAMSVLRNKLNHIGVKPNDLEPLPIPGYFLKEGFVGHGLNLK